MQSKSPDNAPQRAAPTGNSALAAEEVRAIAKEAFIYGYPMVDSYRIQHAFFVDSNNPDYKGPWNQLVNLARVYTPEDRTAQTPNSDTPYSQVGLDLRAEPMVLTVPAIDKERYYSIQLVDAYTHNFGYIGSRTTGTEAGNYLIAGPDWKGETPRGIEKVIRSETHLAKAGYRTQLFNPADIENVKKVQAGYQAQPLSAFLGQPAAPPAPPIDFIKPLTPGEEKTSLEFFNVLNFILQFAPTVPSERDLMARFAKIGVGPGLMFDQGKLSEEAKAAMQQAWTMAGRSSKP